MEELIIYLPTASEVAGIIFGDIDSSFDERDIVVETRTGQLQRISELHPSYLPLLFPLAEDLVLNIEMSMKILSPEEMN